MKIRTFFGLAWQPVLAYGGALLVILGFLLFRLGTLTPGLSQPEIAVANFSGDFHTIMNNPMFAPYTGLIWLLHKLSVVTPFSLRAVSVFYGVFVIFFFYLLLRRWFSMRMAILGTILFATSSWFLHIVRLATPDVMLMSLVVLVFAGTAVKRSQYPQLALTLATLIAAGLLYIPGMVWFVLAAIFWQRRRLLQDLKKYNLLSLLLNVVLFVVLIAPLLWSVIHHPHLLVSIAGVPDHVPSFSQMALNVVRVPWNFFVRGPVNPVIWLGRLPILDIFTTVMFILGVYAYVLHLRLEQAHVLVGIGILSLIFIGLNGPFNITILLPWVYVIVTTGLVYFTQLWLTVFPRNPVARGIGYTLISIAIAVTCFYHLLSYYVAWPHNTVTKAAFTQQLPPK